MWGFGGLKKANGPKKKIVTHLVTRPQAAGKKPGRIVTARLQLLNNI